MVFLISKTKKVDIPNQIDELAKLMVNIMCNKYVYPYNNELPNLNKSFNIYEDDEVEYDIHANYGFLYVILDKKYKEFDFVELLKTYYAGLNPLKHFESYKTLNNNKLTQYITLQRNDFSKYEIYRGNIRSTPYTSTCDFGWGIYIIYNNDKLPNKTDIYLPFNDDLRNIKQHYYPYIDKNIERYLARLPTTIVFDTTELFTPLPEIVKMLGSPSLEYYNLYKNHPLTNAILIHRDMRISIMPHLFSLYFNRQDYNHNINHINYDFVNYQRQIIANLDSEHIYSYKDILHDIYEEIKLISHPHTEYLTDKKITCRYTDFSFVDSILYSLDNKNDDHFGIYGDISPNDELCYITNTPMIGGCIVLEILRNDILPNNLAGTPIAGNPINTNKTKTKKKIIPNPNKQDNIFILCSFMSLFLGYGSKMVSLKSFLQQYNLTYKIHQEFKIPTSTLITNAPICNYKKNILHHFHINFNLLYTKDVDKIRFTENNIKYEGYDDYQLNFGDLLRINNSRSKIIFRFKVLKMD